MGSVSVPLSSCCYFFGVVEGGSPSFPLHFFFCCAYVLTRPLQHFLTARDAKQVQWSISPPPPAPQSFNPLTVPQLVSF